MNPDLWKQNILDVVRQISDTEFQKRSWFGQSEFVSSPDELYCELFDDFLYDDFLKSSNVNSLQRSFGFELKKSMEHYEKKYGESLDPKTVFTDPDWNEVRKAAKNFLDSF